MLLHKLPRAALVAALLLAPAAPASAMFERVCLEIANAGHLANFHMEVMHRGNRSGLDTHYDNFRGERSEKILGNQPAHQTRCVNLADRGIRPGDRLKFRVEAIAGKWVECHPNNRYRKSHEGFWLMPDGPVRGDITFRNWGRDTTNHQCVLRDDVVLRMHSECNATYEGMANAGCQHFRPEITNTVLHDIVRNQSGLGFFGSAIRRGANVNQSVNGLSYAVDRTTPLHIAAWENAAEHAGYLIRAGARLNPHNSNGDTPVMLAVENGNAEVLKVLLDAGASATKGGHRGKFPLYMAAEQNRLDLAELLVEGGAVRGLNDVHDETGKTALDIAKENNSREVLAYLRKLGAREPAYEGIIYDVVAEDRGGNALNRAIADGADLNAIGEGGKTALHLIAERSLQKYLAVFVKEAGKVNFDIQDDRGRTPLLAAVAANPTGTSLVDALLKQTDNPNLADENGDFPLYLVVNEGRFDLLRLFIFNRSVELSQRHGPSGLTPLGLGRQLFAETGRSEYEDIVEFLERRGAL